MCCFDGIVNASISFRILIMHNNTKLRGMNDFICVYVVMIDGLQGVMNVAVRAQISILFKLDPACQRYCVKPHIQYPQQVVSKKCLLFLVCRLLLKEKDLGGGGLK